MNARSLIRMFLALALSLHGAVVFGGDGPANDKEAVASFQRLWRESLAKKMESSPYFKLLSHLHNEPGRVFARLQTSAYSLQRVSGSLSAGEMKQLIVFGTLDDLKPERQLWAVINPGGGPGFEAYLDAKDGHLIFMWVVPEG
ncbi:hypothetical protein [Prosthecobacter sp.]|uniref:hypothetical protein n=1 Tax=Prosthecobacter sp. TaxID=1965333 RepID=UPI003782FD65